jgi:hypothetical protein
MKIVATYSPTRSADPAVVSGIETLQRWLSTFPGVLVKVDGVAGPLTSTAYRTATGHYLPGDPREAA